MNTSKPQESHEESLELSETLKETLTRKLPDDSRVVVENTTLVSSPETLMSNHLAVLMLNGDQPPSFEPYPGLIEDLKRTGLSRKGKIIIDLIANKDFIDLGCGKVCDSWIPRKMAQYCKTKSYVGVDVLRKNLFYKNPYANAQKIAEDALKGDQEIAAIYSQNVEGFPMSWVEADALTYVSKMNDMGNNGKVFCICGLDSGSDRDDALFRHPQTGKNYFDLMVEELNRLTKNGDIILTVLLEEKFLKIFEQHGFISLKKVFPEFEENSKMGIEIFVKQEAVDDLRRRFAKKLKTIKDLK
ncbi:MAG: hypothetical protein US89_C0002G0040 [Candidatus Peregrinibacteria bacterium GW2011_GWF2_38_29]|nr:MAG: hypothetical protein US89_C0002G0040 [Candidatus Peregrinibacteria bacterium GW2011_GWF2_38_29]HBB02196.1 hypothetical protein [Candidatus Peregrinibacteria bacterium]